jgi:ABC-type antimicrobial peptide transport system permease subunit
MVDDLPRDASPWHLLEQDLDAGEGGAPVIPAFADSASAQWILKVGVGDEVEVPGLGGRPVRLRIVGLLEPSVFQGVLLVGEADFLERFGSESGYQFFLVAVPPGQTGAAVDALRTDMSEFGVMVRRTSEVLASFARVQNTYLATFRTLGGLGLLLGTFGIVTVLLRAVVERRREMAMLMAVGLRRGRLSGMIIIENGMLLILGIVVGGAAALVAVAPHLASAMADVNWVALAVTLGACLAVGLASCAIAASLSMQGDLLPALRSE